MVYKLRRWLSTRMSELVTSCALCGADGADRSGTCQQCRHTLPTLQFACPLCALPLASSAPGCPSCLKSPPAMARTRVAWRYAYPVAQMIQQFKYQGDMAIGRALAIQSSERLQPGSDRPDLLVPIPLHWRRTLQRGFNQSHLIARVYSEHWQIPLAGRLLRKRSGGKRQQLLDRRQRLSNLAGSFRVRGDCSGLHLGLVDDVITTGATLEAAASALLHAGATKVSAFALARTP